MDQPPPLPTGPEQPDDVLAVLKEILAQLRRLNENVLLTDDQRRAKARDEHDRLRRDLSGTAEAAMAAGDFGSAERAIADLADKLPGDEAIAALARRLDETRNSARDNDLAAVTSQIADMMAVGLFSQAEAEAEKLRGRYPQFPPAGELLDRVRREARMLQDERRDRMYGEVARLAETRQWRQALDSAQKFVQAFPEGTAADTVRAMLETMQDNARIEEVRELRDSIRDLIERRRYAEALDQANDVIQRFPDTKAAEELGRQIGRLRELARQSQ